MQIRVKISPRSGRFFPGVSSTKRIFRLADSTQSSIATFVRRCADDWCEPSGFSRISSWTRNGDNWRTGPSHTRRVCASSKCKRSYSSCRISNNCDGDRDPKFAYYPMDDCCSLSRVRVVLDNGAWLVAEESGAQGRRRCSSRRLVWHFQCYLRHSNRDQWRILQKQQAHGSTNRY